MQVMAETEELYRLSRYLLNTGGEIGARSSELSQKLLNSEWDDTIKEATAQQVLQAHGNFNTVSNILEANADTIKKIAKILEEYLNSNKGNYLY